MAALWRVTMSAGPARPLVVSDLNGDGVYETVQFDSDDQGSTFDVAYACPAGGQVAGQDCDSQAGTDATIRWNIEGVSSAQADFSLDIVNTDDAGDGF